MPGLIKIGKTQNDPDERAKELMSPTGVAGLTVIQYAAWVDEYGRVEQAVLDKFPELEGGSSIGSIKRI